MSSLTLPFQGPVRTEATPERLRDAGQVSVPPGSAAAASAESGRVTAEQNGLAGADSPGASVRRSPAETTSAPDDGTGHRGRFATDDVAACPRSVEPSRPTR